MYMYSARFNNAGVNIKAMKVMPGHRNIDTAMQICSDAIERYERIINKLVPAYFPTKTPGPLCPQFVPNQQGKYIRNQGKYTSNVFLSGNVNITTWKIKDHF